MVKTEFVVVMTGLKLKEHLVPVAESPCLALAGVLSAGMVVAPGELHGLVRSVELLGDSLLMNSQNIFGRVLGRFHREEHARISGWTVISE